MELLTIIIRAEVIDNLIDLLRLLHQYLVRLMDNSNNVRVFL